MYELAAVQNSFAFVKLHILYNMCIIKLIIANYDNLLLTLIPQVFSLLTDTKLSVYVHVFPLPEPKHCACSYAIK